MDTPAAGSPHTGALFIDLEHFGVPCRTEHFNKQMEWLLRGVRLAFKKEDVKIRKVWAVARRRVGEHLAVRKHHDELVKLFTSHNGVISWPISSIADDSLIGEIERQLAVGALPPVVIIVTGDSDFMTLVEKIRDSGRSVTVTGHRFGLIMHNHPCTVNIEKLIGSKMPRAPKKKDLVRHYRKHRRIR